MGHGPTNHINVVPLNGAGGNYSIPGDYLYRDMAPVHVYNGIFGANMANMLRRFQRLGAHYGSTPRIIACSATIGNPRELALQLTGREMVLVDQDGSPVLATFVYGAGNDGTTLDDLVTFINNGFPGSTAGCAIYSPPWCPRWGKRATSGASTY